MRVKNILNNKYNDNHYIGINIKSTSVCMLYNDIIQKKFPNLTFSKAKSIKNNILNVEVSHNLEAQEIKLYEFEIKELLNLEINNSNYSVEKLNIKVNFI